MTLITLDQARALLLADVSTLESERVDLDEAPGRTLAEPILATHTQPAERRATMDGIAIPDTNPSVGTAWRLVGDAPAGSKPGDALEAGEAIRIATGAVVPDGAERVLPQEILQFSSQGAVLVAEPASARFIRQRGADFSRGEVLLERGVLIGPGQLSLIAAANCSSAVVVRAPRIAILTAGDELVPPGSALGAGQSVDSASHALAALIRRWGGSPRMFSILPDKLSSIVAALTAAVGTSDVIVCIGGASVGACDQMRPAAIAIGARLLFEGVAVQPGKPCWHARLKEPASLLGLPGNPSSAFVCAHLLLLPLLEKLMGRSFVDGLQPAALTTSLPANGEREQYLRAIVSRGDDGRLLVTPVGDQDSGLQASLATAKVLIRRLAGAGPLEPGARVNVLQLT